MSTVRDDRPKVLYIAGWGRSGTTLMDNLLGSHHGVFTAGELTLLWRFGFLEERRCGCRVPLVGCELWRAVLDRAFGADVPDAARMIELQRRAVPVRRTASLISAARTGKVDAAAAEYADVMGRLYRAIADETGARVIVDASKRPSDAVATALAPGVDPYLLHMIRDPRACAYSWRRRVVEPDARTHSEMTQHGRLMNVGHWVSWNVAAEAAARAYPAGHYRRLRYEDFMTDPRGTVGGVLEFLEEPADGGPFVDRDTAVLPDNHTVAGNPKRFRTGEVRIRLDDEWCREQPAMDRYTTTVLSLPMLPRYGYPAVGAGATARPEWLTPAGGRSSSR